MKSPQISIVLPCRNEEKALPFCIQEIKRVIQKEKLSAEIIVSDSSTDKSPIIAQKEGVVLIKHDRQGYGNAYKEGFKIAKGNYLIMADADATYDFSQIPVLIKELKTNDLVIANRFAGTMEKNAMPFLHRYIGNPLLSGIIRLLFNTTIQDSQSGMRAIKKDSLQKLNLQTTGMEFASEMIIKALENNFKIKEIPIDYKKRIGYSKLNRITDTWRHIRFMLLYSPLFLFFLPGIILFFLGINLFTLLYYDQLKIFGIQFYVHPLFIASLFIIVGYQLIILSVFAKTYAITHLNEKPLFQNAYHYITLEKGIIVGSILSLIGAGIFLAILNTWITTNFGNLEQIKNGVLALTLVVIGIQTIFSAFMLSILGIKEK